MFFVNGIAHFEDTAAAAVVVSKDCDGDTDPDLKVVEEGIADTVEVVVVVAASGAAAVLDRTFHRHSWYGRVGQTGNPVGGSAACAECFLHSRKSKDSPLFLSVLGASF